MQTIGFGDELGAEPGPGNEPRKPPRIKEVCRHTPLLRPQIFQLRFSRKGGSTAAFSRECCGGQG